MNTFFRGIKKTVPRLFRGIFPEWNSVRNPALKVHKHEIFFYFFAETVTIWSQGPVTREFWKWYSSQRDIQLLNISAHAQHAMKSVPRMLSKRRKTFRAAQNVIKFVPRMLNMDCTCKNCSHFTAGWACAEIRMLSVRWNRFCVCSACDKIVSKYAQHTHAIIFEKYSKIPN